MGGIPKNQHTPGVDYYIPLTSCYIDKIPLTLPLTIKIPIPHK